MYTSNLLDAVVQKPKVKANCSIIWLHGLGASGHDFEDVAPMLNLPSDMYARFIFPHAPVQPVTINQGLSMRAWYDIKSLTPGATKDHVSVVEAQPMINAWLNHESEMVGSERVFLLGFSQGGAVASYCALRYDKPLAGCAILSGYVCLQEKLKAELSIANKQLPIFMAHGTEDAVVTFDIAQKSYAALQECGLEPEFKSYPMAHQVCTPELTHLGKWLVEKLKG